MDKQSGDGNDDSVAIAKALKVMWLELKNSVKRSPSGHALRDIAWLDLVSLANEVPDVPEKKVNLQSKYQVKKIEDRQTDRQ